MEIGISYPVRIKKEAVRIQQSISLEKQAVAFS
jgi:hypothetical protein